MCECVVIAVHSPVCVNMYLLLCIFLLEHIDIPWELSAIVCIYNTVSHVPPLS